MEYGCFIILCSFQLSSKVSQLYGYVHPILWPPDVKSGLTGKDPDDGKDCGWEKKEVTEGEMVGWHHRLNGHEFEQTPADGEGGKQGVLQSMGSQRVRHD